MSGWNAACRRSGIVYHRIVTDTPFGHALRVVLANSSGMTFLHPWLLAGLLAAGVPLLLHLVQRREPPTVVFPAVRYLLDATREHQRRLRIRHWLLLLLRTLLIVALVLAAAGPTVRRSGVTEPCARAPWCWCSTTA